MRHSTRLARAGVAAACLAAALAAHASPLPQLSDYAAVGSGTLRYFGLRIYDATLWSPGGAWSAGKPYALELRYARRFEGAAIARRSIEEMRAQRTHPAATLARWETQMRALFPDVELGDRLTGVRIPGAGAAFYSGTRKLGQIDDEAFADAFFGIWLDPASRAPELRARLLGAS
ncbi:MAG: chalcone isomerase family protein [Thiobacillus sp.]|nr:chalcone isomerase family protein [Thiobacillus sp.]